MPNDPFALTKPCPDCPFRTDRGFVYITGGRAEEIIASLTRGEMFPCHKTVHYEDTDDLDEAEYEMRGDEAFCAGALLIIARSELPNALTQISERLGIYDPSALDHDSPVYGSAASFIAAHKGVRHP
jgi:hypothetical protein